MAGSDLELAKRVARLSAVLGHATEEALAEHGLTKAEYEILARLRSEPVTREPDPDDRRSSWVRLTPRGVRVTEQLVRDAVEAQADVLAPLPEATRKQLTDLLRDVLLAVDPAHRRRRRRPG